MVLQPTEPTENSISSFHSAVKHIFLQAWCQGKLDALYKAIINNIYIYKKNAICTWTRFYDRIQLWTPDAHSTFHIDNMNIWLLPYRFEKQKAANAWDWPSLRIFPNSRWGCRGARTPSPNSCWGDLQTGEEKTLDAFLCFTGNRWKALESWEYLCSFLPT